MKCPDCGKPVGDHDAVCPNCGKALYEETTLMKNIMNVKEKPAETQEKSDKLGKLKKGLNGKKLKLILIGCAVVLLIALAIIVIVSVTSSKGEKAAAKTAKYIGVELSEAEKKLDITFKDKSAYAGVRNALTYNYVYEAEGTVKVDGITYPEWAVLVTVSDEDKIETVKYANFEILSDDPKGEERSKVVNLDRFEKGASWSDISDEIGLDFYSVTYGKNSSEYVYKYHYNTENGDVQPVVLKVSFDNDGKYSDYTSTLLYPEYM